MATVMIVDDASFMRGSLRFILEQAGHTVVGEAKEGKEAMKLYRELKPQFVTLDILMKGMEGLDALREIRKINPDAKVIMVTALGQEEKQKEARELGAAGYIRKPFKREEITGEIARLLAGD